MARTLATARRRPARCRPTGVEGRRLHPAADCARCRPAAHDGPRDPPCRGRCRGVGRARAGEGVPPGQGAAGAGVLDPPSGPRWPGAWPTQVRARPPAPLPVAVVCDDDEVADVGRRRTAPQVLWRPGRGLERRGRPTASPPWPAEGVDRVIVAHADLPLATDLAWAGRLRRASRSCPTGATTAPTWSACPPAPASRSPTGPARSPATAAEAAAARAWRCGSCASPAWRGTSTCPPTSDLGRRDRPTTPLASMPLTIDRDLPDAGPGPGHRRPPRRRRVRLRRHAGQVGGGRAAWCTTWSAPTARRAPGTRRPTPPRWSPPARTSSGPRPGRSAATGEVVFLGWRRRRARGRACASAGEVAYWIRRAAARRRARPRPVEALPPPPRPPPRRLPRRRRRRRRPRPALLPRAGRRPPPPAGAAAVRGRRARPRRGRRPASPSAKLAALLAHRSQFRSTMGIDEDGPDAGAQLAAFRSRIETGLAATGRPAGVTHAEAYARLDPGH